MAAFPNRFVDAPEVLQSRLAGRGNRSLVSLNDRGYDVAVGLTRDYAEQIRRIAVQPHIVEYCPNDAGPQRFASETSTEQWLKKSGGRGVFLLLERGAGDRADLVGYGWSGLGGPPEMADYRITTAYRLAEAALGRRLAGDFIQTVIAATHQFFAEGAGIGLETWRSNPAVGLYRKLGFLVLELGLSTGPEWRPTLDPDTPDGKVLDERLYMGYPTALLD